jgi:hypothetical protein
LVCIPVKNPINVIYGGFIWCYLLYTHIALHICTLKDDSRPVFINYMQSLMRCRSAACTYCWWAYVTMKWIVWCSEVQFSFLLLFCVHWIVSDSTALACEILWRWLICLYRQGPGCSNNEFYEYNSSQNIDIFVECVRWSYQFP